MRNITVDYDMGNNSSSVEHIISKHNKVEVAMAFNNSGLIIKTYSDPREFRKDIDRYVSMPGNAGLNAVDILRVNGKVV
jgi:hypothetical protein